MRIFWSWQSWSPKKTNWNFIEEAIKKAIKNMKSNETIDFVPVLDRATDGTFGAVDIADTILSKIDDCDIFICDLTLVTSQDALNQIPNPNVLFELGYAAKRLDWSSIIIIQNTAFGSKDASPKELPFDIRKRKILTYHLPEISTNKANIKRNLIARIQSALEFALENYSNSKINKVEDLLLQDNNIQLDQYFTLQINSLFSKMVSEEFIQQRQEILERHANNSYEMWEAGIEHYFLACKPVLEDFVQLTVYGDESQAHFVSQAMVHWTEHLSEANQSYTLWRFLPSLFLIYTVGIIALEKQKWTYLRAIFYGTKIEHPTNYNPRNYSLNIILEFTTIHYDSRSISRSTPRKFGYLYESYLRPLMSKFLFSDTEYYQAFDIFEFVVGLHILYERTNNSSLRRFVPVTTNIRRSEKYILEQLEEWGKEGSEFGLLTIDLFNGSHNTLHDMLLEYYKLKSSYNRPFDDPLSNFQQPYKQGLTYYLRSR